MMPRFQVGVTVTSNGYMELDARDAEAARKKVQGVEIGLDIMADIDVDTSLMDGFVDIRVDDVQEVEPEDAA